MTTILYNKKILITAGPTREAMDPVRYISNHSSGKMGFAIAEQFLSLGAEVYLVAGPVGVSLQHPKLRIIHVHSASEMYLACCRYFEIVDVAVFAAAVADYRPAKVSEKKIKKEETTFTIKMTRNVDIAFEFGKIKTDQQVSIGFALETNNELAHATGKLQKKNFDMVILNSMRDEQATFGFDTNKISIIRKNLSCRNFLLKNKKEVAKDIVSEITDLLVSKYFPAPEQINYEL